jgi:predicted AAA+ superfamily ATPase
MLTQGAVADGFGGIVYTVGSAHSSTDFRTAVTCPGRRSVPHFFPLHPHVFCVLNAVALRQELVRSRGYLY